MKVILYVRASTEDQQTTLEVQAARLAAYATALDLEVVATLEDAGESAKSLDRPGLQQALAMLKRGEADGLAVVKLDRLTRSVADWQVLIDGWFGERAGKQLFAVNDSIDTRTAGGRLVLNVLLSVAQWEREAIAERTRDVLRHKIKTGKRVGNLRFGYDLEPDGKSVTPNATEQATIERMTDLREAGFTLREIAAELTGQGIPTKQRRGAWSSAAVARILNRAVA